MTDEEFYEALGIRDSVDHVGQYVLMFRAVEVLRAEPQIDLSTFGWKSGLVQTTHAGLAGSYMQVARKIIERMK